MKPSIVLGLLLALNLVSTAFHYTDNALFIDRYPEPDWFTTAGVFATFAIMTPLAFVGYWLYQTQRLAIAYACLLLYSLTGISSLGHYLYRAVIPMSGKMHLLIASDAIVGFSLVGFVIWSMWVGKEGQRRSAE